MRLGRNILRATDAPAPPHISVPDVELGTAERLELAIPVSRYGRRQIGIGMLLQKLVGRRVGVTRGNERDLQEERLRAVVRTQESHRCLARPMRVVQTLRERIGFGRIVIPSKPHVQRIKIRSVASEPRVVIIPEGMRDLVENHLVKAVVGADRAEFHLADPNGVVAGIAQRARQFDRIVRGDGPAVHAEQAVAPSRETREQRGACRNTAWGRCVGLAESGATTCEGIEIGAHGLRGCRQRRCSRRGADRTSAGGCSTGSFGSP